MKFASMSILALLGSGVVAQATEYPAAGLAESPVRVTIHGDEEVPPVDPENPNPDPENPNPDPELLDILYASPLEFGSVTLDGEEQILDAADDRSVNGDSFSPMVSIRDRRSDDTRSGWALSVKFEEEFLDGAEIRMNPFVHENNALLGIVGGGEITVGVDAQLFASTTTEGYARHSVSMAMAQPDEAVQLVIPGETDVDTGEYTTTLVWELTDAPL